MNLIQLLILISLLIQPAVTQAFPAKFAASPDNSQELLLKTLNSAKSSILLNVYLISNPALTEVLKKKIKNGVSLEMLIEAETFGTGISPQERLLLETISAECQKHPKQICRVYMMTGNKGEKPRRYVYDHAKYIVVDSSIAYISSENFTNSAMGDPHKKGNRGWQTQLNDPSTARKLSEIFTQDTNLSFGDVVEYKAISHAPVPQDSNAIDQANPDNTRAINPFPLGNGNVESVSICASPNSLPCITDFIRSAKSNLLIQHLSLPLYWSKKTNPIIDEAIEAAKRGVYVRIILSTDENGKAPTSASNKDTVNYINQISSKEKLPIQAVLANLKALELTIIHNKGMVADTNKVFISSINGTENSVMKNREIAVSLDSKDAANYFTNIFNFDWSKSYPETL